MSQVTRQRRLVGRARLYALSKFGSVDARSTPAHLGARVIASGFGFLEGPRWRDGKIWVSDFHRRHVFKIDPTTGATEPVCVVPEQPSGIGFLRDGTVVVASMKDRRLLALRDGELRQLADLSSFTPHPINDLVVDSRDRIYVGSFGCTPGIDQTLGPAPVIRVDPDGRASVVSTDLTFPNGLAFSANEHRLYIADTFGARLAVFDVDAKGELSLSSFVPFADRVHPSMPSAWASNDLLPDGLALDDRGSIWVADANAPRVAVVDPRRHGTTVLDIGGSDLRVYAVAFAPDGRLFACVAPRVETWDVLATFPSQLVELVAA